MYIYFTKSHYLMSAKTKRFTNCYGNLFVQITDENLDVSENGILFLFLNDFYKRLESYKVLDKIKNLEYKSDSFDRKMWLKDLGLNESFINAEYSSLDTKYYDYYKRCKTAYDIWNSFIVIKNTKNKTKEHPIENDETGKYHEYEIIRFGNHYAIKDLRTGEICSHADSYAEAKEDMDLM